MAETDEERRAREVYEAHRDYIKTGKKEEKAMAEEIKGREFCQTCFPQGHRLEDKVEKLTEKNIELEKMVAAAEQVKAQPAETLKQPANAEEHTKPSEALFELWENCPNCKPGLMAYQLKVATDVVTNLTKPENKPKLAEIIKTAGLELMPDKFIIRR